MIFFLQYGIWTENGKNIYFKYCEITLKNWAERSAMLYSIYTRGMTHSMPKMTNIVKHWHLTKSFADINPNATHLNDGSGPWSLVPGGGGTLVQQGGRWADEGRRLGGCIGGSTEVVVLRGSGGGIRGGACCPVQQTREVGGGGGRGGGCHPRRTASQLGSQDLLLLQHLLLLLLGSQRLLDLGEKGRVLMEVEAIEKGSTSARILEEDKMRKIQPRGIDSGYPKVSFSEVGLVHFFRTWIFLGKNSKSRCM